jgi:DNA polymerase-3 subunit beta
MLLIKATRDALLRPLQSVIGIVERRHTLPILSNVLIEKHTASLSFVATDLEIQITASAPTDSSQPDFALTVSGKKLQDICRAFPESAEITLEMEESRLQLKVGKSRFNLQTLPANDFPKLSEPAGPTTKIQLPQKTLRHLFNQVQYAMAQQDIRYYLNGLLLVLDADTLRVVATDGHRLSFASAALVPEENLGPESLTETQEVILPRKTVIELVKLLGDNDDQVDLEISPNQIRFSFSNITLVSKIVEGKFPDYTKVIPANYKNHLELDRFLLLQALQRASILSNEKFRGVRLVMTQNSMRILSNNNEQEEAQEELEVVYSGDPLDIGFNVTYLLDVLNNVNTETVVLSFGDANSSGLVTVPGNDNFKYVVMPMRI